tara:strand:- start:368 stop:652 length:285 start_codon:yes stop_codon:yes gene_type:complete
MSDSKKLRKLKEIRIKNLQKNLLDIQLKGIEHRININARNKAEIVAKSGSWVTEHIRTAILKYNFEIDKIAKLLVKDFTKEEVKQYEEIVSSSK